MDMRQPRQVRCVLDQHGIQDAVQLKFVRTGEANQIVSRTQAINIDEANTRIASSQDIKILKKRINQYSNETLLID